MKRYQANFREMEHRHPSFRRSGSTQRNWRQRLVLLFESHLNLLLNSINQNQAECLIFSHCLWNHTLQRRKVLRAYENSWNNRCRLLFCCIHNSESSRVSKKEKSSNRYIYATKHYISISFMDGARVLLLFELRQKS
jgi:hypothetical protein